MQELTGSTLTAEVEKKLDDLFQEEQPEEDLQAEQVLEDESSAQQPKPPHEDSAEKTGSPLAPLKSIVLSLEWEITDQAMDDFLSQTEALRSRCEGDQVLKTFIQMLQALGKYIKRHKGESHPDAVRLLSASFQSFEEAFEQTNLSESNRKSLLDERIKEFMALKQAIGAKRKPMSAGSKGAMADAQTIRETMEGVMRQFIGEVRQMFVEELEKLKSELKGQQEG